jgi:hypothetical protein
MPNIGIQLYVAKWVDASYSGSQMARVPVLKNHIYGKINIRMEKKC